MRDFDVDKLAGFHGGAAYFAVDVGDVHSDVLREGAADIAEAAAVAESPRWVSAGCAGAGVGFEVVERPGFGGCEGAGDASDELRAGCEADRLGR